MPKKGHTEEEIIAALKQYEGGEKTADMLVHLHVLSITRRAPRSAIGDSGTK